MSKRLLDYDPVTQMAQYFEYDAITGTQTICTVQDVEPILEINKALQNAPEMTQKGVKNDFLRVAHIPNVVVEHWIKHEGASVYDKHDWPKIKRLLNSPDWAYLRTTPTGWRI